jgi:hypothetical protein
MPIIRPMIPWHSDSPKIEKVKTEKAMIPAGALVFIQDSTTKQFTPIGICSEANCFEEYSYGYLNRTTILKLKTSNISYLENPQSLKIPEILPGPPPKIELELEPELDKETNLSRDW